MNFDKEPGDIMVLEYCHEPKEGQGTPFEAFGTSLYFKKVSAQKVPNREISGRLLSPGFVANLGQESEFPLG